MDKTEGFGKLVHVEAERRGLRQARTVLVMGDGGNWIDPLSKREHLHDQRIVDYYHAAEHLYEAARAALGKEASESLVLAEQLKDLLWDGQLDQVIALLKTHGDRLGPPQKSDGPDHPRECWPTTWATFRRTGITWITRRIEPRVGRSSPA